MWIWKASALLTFACFIVGVTACSRSPMDQAEEAFSADAILQGTQLTKTYCNTCHGVGDRELDAMLAPPLLGVRDVYIERYPDPEAFVDAVVAFTQHPKRENSLMPHAVEQYGLKASVSMAQNELRLAAIALFAEQVERPKWMREYRKAHAD